LLFAVFGLTMGLPDEGGGQAAKQAAMYLEK